MSTLSNLDIEMPGSPVRSDNSMRSDNSIHSSASSEQSETSTLQYEQESWNNFRPRVEELCRTLWPQQRKSQSFWNNEVVARLRKVRFLRQIFPCPEAPIIERLHGGDYNRITSITLPSPISEEGRNLILRVPRWGKGQTERASACLEYLSRESSIPVAAVIAKDIGRENPLNSPYILQDRLVGKDLELLWDSLDHSQRCTVAREIGSVIRSLLVLESPAPGHITASQSKETAKTHTVVPFDLANVDGDRYEESDGQKHYLAIPWESQSILDFFQCQISRWRAVDLARNGGTVDDTIGLWDGMMKVIRQRSERSLFAQVDHCLCHPDLHPRNVMAHIQDNGCIQVTGILDWDEAIVAPKFMCSEPPGWIWGFDPDNLPYDDLPGWPYEKPGADDMPPTMEQQELKRIFEEHAGPEYLSLAYDPKCRMSRGLFRIALFGLTSSENYDAAERLISDWKELQECLIK